MDYPHRAWWPVKYSDDYAYPRYRLPPRTWSKAEVRKFLARASSDRLCAAWRLSLYGPFRGEVLGLR